MPEKSAGERAPQCDDVDGSQYAFSEEDTDGYGGTTWEATYCLVGLGSYSAD